MNFFDWLDKTREKPEPVRKRIALFFTVAFVIVIAFVWLTIFLYGR